MSEKQPVSSQIIQKKPNRTIQNKLMTKFSPNFLSDWIAEKIFTLIHQNNLAYTTAWEDPRLDRIALDIQPEDTILMITTGGCNVLDYALLSPQHIYSVDINPHQSALLELKIAAIHELDFDLFWQLFGKGHLSNFPEIYQEKLHSWLSPFAQKYWMKNGAKFFHGKKSFYRQGTSGSVISFMNFMIDKVLKLRDYIDQTWEVETIIEQKEIYDKYLRKKLKPFLRLLLSNDLALWMNCVPPQQRQQVELDFGCSIGEVYDRWNEELYTTILFRDNYFHRMIFYGEYSPTCCPEYLKPENFYKLKEGLVNKISVHTCSVETFLKENNVQISCYVLLDHMDWLSTYDYEKLVSEWQAIIERSTSNARVIFRSMLSKVNYLDEITVAFQKSRKPLNDFLVYDSQLAQELHRQDRTHIYGSFYIAYIKTLED